MVYGVYAVFDAAVALYGQPFFMRTDREAVRGVASLLADANHPWAKTPGDYTLFLLGQWTEADGRFDMLDAPRRMVTLLELKANLEK